MKRRISLGLASLAAALIPAVVLAQAEQRPAREFPAFRGTWTIDEPAGRGHIAGLPVARTLVITTTPTELSVTKDGNTAETYRLDGADKIEGDSRSNVVLVADTLAATTRRTRRDRGYAFTNVITDAYGVNGDTLTIERQLSVVVSPVAPRDGRTTDGVGHLAELEDPRNNRQTIVYRRSR
jgi:hypothetical protein